jgi:hypothetical protein
MLAIYSQTHKTSRKETTANFICSKIKVYKLKSITGFFRRRTPRKTWQLKKGPHCFRKKYEFSCPVLQIMATPILATISNCPA